MEHTYGECIIACKIGFTVGDPVMLNKESGPTQTGEVLEVLSTPFGTLYIVRVGGYNIAYSGDELLLITGVVNDG